MPKILGPDAQPLQPSNLRELQTEQLSIIRSLASEHDEHPARQLTPSRIHAILREAEQGNWLRLLDLASDMEELDTQIFSEMDKRKKGVLKLDWDIAAPDRATAKETEQAETLKAWLHALPQFKRTVMWPLLDGILKGFAAVEMCWELQQGQLMPTFTERPQRWFCQSECRQKIHLRDASVYGQPLQPYKWLLHRHPARSGYPARQGLVRVLAFPYLYKNYSTRDLAEFLEIYGLPLRLGKYPGGSTDAEKLTLLRAVTEIGHNAAGIIPQGMEIDFQNAAQGTQVPFEAMLNRMDAALSKAIIGQTLTSGEGQHGTQALGNVHNNIRLDILAADAELLSNTLTDQLLRPLALLNLPGANPARLPRFVLEVPEPEDIKLMAEALPKLAQAGVQIGVNWVAAKLRIPALDAGEQALKGTPEPEAPQAPAVDAPAAQAKKALMKAALLAALPAGPAPVRDALDDVVDEAVAQWQPMMEPVLAPVFAQLGAALGQGKTLAEFAAELQASMPELSAQMQAGPLAERLAQAGFVAALAGHADLDL